MKEAVALGRLLDVCVDEKGVRLRVDILYHDLEAVEAACLRDLDLAREALDQVFVDNAVRGGKEGEDVRDEVSFVIIQTVVPVVEIL